MTSLRQFFDERGGPDDPDHPGFLSWQSADNLPLIGDVNVNGLMLKRSELETKTSLLVRHRSKRFDMSVEKDRNLYDSIQTKIATGWFIEKTRTEKWPDGAEAPLIWLEWVQRYRQFTNTVEHRSYPYDDDEGR